MSRTAGLRHLLPSCFGIVGAGQLGTGIADLACRVGFDKVIIVDSKKEAIDKARSALVKALDKAKKARVITPERMDEALAAAAFSTDLAALHGAEFVVEAIPEIEARKKEVFAYLDNICSPDAVLSSNTSSISITRLASATKRPENVIGMHFMNPPVKMELLEIIGGKATAQRTFERAQTVALHMGKVVCYAEDRPGFIVNRLLMPLINEAFFVLMEGVAQAEDIDVAMRKGTNMPMGPLLLADYIGLDTCLSIMRVLHSGLGEDKYRPCPLLVQHVDAGWLGVKTRRGGVDCKMLFLHSAPGSRKPALSCAGVYMYPDGALINRIVYLSTPWSCISHAVYGRVDLLEGHEVHGPCVQGTYHTCTASPTNIDDLA